MLTMFINGGKNELKTSITAVNCDLYVVSAFMTTNVMSLHVDEGKVAVV